VPGLKDRLQELMQDRTGSKVVLEESVDESLIGGFVLQVEDLRMDASVEGQLRRLRRELLSDTNRIV
jgi:F-type H+-transporting ATPase subunit delta